MSSSPSPTPSFSSLFSQFPHRAAQLHALSALLSPSLPSPSTILLHGPPSTGKSRILRASLSALSLPHAVVDVRECVTGRQCLERALSGVLEATSGAGEIDGGHEELGRCDSVLGLRNGLERVLRANARRAPGDAEGGGMRKFVLVFDGLDGLREAPMTMAPALARFGETIPELVVVLVVRTPSLRLLGKTGVPHVEFPAYTREEVLAIVQRDTPEVFSDRADAEGDGAEERRTQDCAWVWERFCAVVWDSLGKAAARDLVSFRDLCRKLWTPFVQPIVDGQIGARDFSRLMVSRRHLFQGDEALVESIVMKRSETTVPGRLRARATHDLPYYSKYLLIAAYLASYNSPRTDSTFFMQAHENRRGRRRTAAATPSKALLKNRRIPRNLLAPSPFPLERLLAILHALLPHGCPQTADIPAQIATLASLRLLLRTGVASDALDPGGKWRVNVGWEVVSALGRSVGLEVRDFVSWAVD